MRFLELILESSLLVLMVMGIRKAFTGKIRYAGIYALWFLVMLRFLIPVNLISTPFGIGGTLPETIFSGTGDDLFRSSQKQAADEAAKPGAVFIKGKSTEEDRMVELESYGKYAAGTEQGQESGIRGAGGISGNAVSLVRCIWLVISALLLAWFALSNMRLTKKLKKSRVLYGNRNSLKIYITEEIKNPCLYGFFRPAIYLPQKLVSDGSLLDSEEWDYMITHEYVHYRHGDHIWAMLRVLLLSVYWFDPFLWLAVSCFKKDAELFCDETVIRLIGEKQRFCYGKMLVRLAGESRWGEFRYPVMPMSRRGKEMAKRIHAISAQKKYSRWLILPLAILVLAATGITCSTKSVPSAGEETVEEDAEPGKKAGGTASDSAGGQAGHALQDPDSVLPGAGYVSADSAAGNPISAEDKKNVGKAFEQYMKDFTDAVNTGNTDMLSRALLPGSSVYEQQCSMAKNYYKRGIREKILSCQISSINAVSSKLVIIASREKIKVSYADADAKVIKQKYRYTCELVGRKWMITKMDDDENG